MPDGLSPVLLKPKLDKLDLPALYDSLSKYLCLSECRENIVENVFFQRHSVHAVNDLEIFKKTVFKGIEYMLSMILKLQDNSF